MQGKAEKEHGDSGRELETRLGRARDAQCMHACIEYANYGISEL